MKRFLTLVGTALATLSAGPALALSCMAPDVAQSYRRAMEADQNYAVFHGQLAFDDPMLPAPDLSNPNPTEHRFEARFFGTEVTSGRMTDTEGMPVTVELGCAGPWCAGVPKPGYVLAFFEVHGKALDQIVLRLDACPGWLFEDPTPDQLAQVERCGEIGC